jgi:hypothetical protein
LQADSRPAVSSSSGSCGEDGLVGSPRFLMTCVSVDTRDLFSLQIRAPQSKISLTMTPSLFLLSISSNTLIPRELHRSVLNLLATFSSAKGSSQTYRAVLLKPPSRAKSAAESPRALTAFVSAPSSTKRCIALSRNKESSSLILTTR